MIIEKSNRLQLHYFFYDDSHGFDAIVRNECEKELLQVYKEIANTLNLKLLIEAEAPKDGGFVEFWTFIGENAVQITVLVSAAAIFLSRIPVENKKLTRLQIENLELENEIKRKELDSLRLKSKTEDEISRELISKVVELLNLNYKIIWRRSNFYKKVIQYRRIEKISSQRYLGNEPIGKERMNKRSVFPRFILDNDELPDITTENAVIDLISPVLKSGRFQWKGFFNSDIINFEMLDNDFGRMVQHGEIRLNNKVSITTRLQQSRKIDENGNIRTFKSRVLEVLKYNIDGQITVTRNDDS